jgi:hypothetical protein
MGVEYILVGERLTFLTISLVALLLSSTQSQAYVSSNTAYKYVSEQATQTHLETLVEFVDIQTVPEVVIVGLLVRFKATMINNSPYTLTYDDGCESPISVVFNKNIKIEHLPSCQTYSTIELKPGEEVSVIGPDDRTFYIASDSGLTVATVTFTYEIQNESRSVSETTAFMVERAPDITVELDTEFQLKINQSALIQPNKMIIKFSKAFEESRCPADTVCVWEGQTSILVSLYGPYSDLNTPYRDTRSFNLTSKAGDEDLAVKNFGDYSIRLVKMEPYPTTNEIIEISEYVATLTVSRSRQADIAAVYVKAVEGKDVDSNESDNYMLLASWNLHNNKGIVLLLKDGYREVKHLEPISAECMDLISLDECIASGIYLNGTQLGGSGLHIGIDQHDLKLILTLLDKDLARIIFDIRQLKI